MNDPDVAALLKRLGIRGPRGDNGSGDETSVVIAQLMNAALQCLGAIRLLCVEEEQARVSNDMCDIDGAMRSEDGGRGTFTQ
jgi:hypothetical protein